MTLRVLKTVSIITLITFILLELSLRFISTSFLFFRNPISFLNNTDALTIMTVGESTTAYGFSKSYPRQLETILEEKLNHDVEVINVSVPGTTTSELRAKLPMYLAEYKPDIITFMTGINDLSQRKKIENKNFLNNFATYRLITEFLRHSNKDMSRAHDSAIKKAEKKASTLSFISVNKKEYKHIVFNLKKQAFNTFNPTPYVDQFSQQKINQLLIEYFYLCTVRNNSDCQKLYNVLRFIPNIQKSDTFLLAYFQAAMALGDLNAIEQTGNLLIKNSPSNAHHVASTLHNHFNEVRGWKHWELTSYFYDQWQKNENDPLMKLEVFKQHIEFLITSVIHTPFKINVEKVKSHALKRMTDSKHSNDPELVELRKRVTNLKGRQITNIDIKKIRYDRIIGDSRTHQNQRAMAIEAQEFGAHVIIVQYPMLSVDHLKEVYLGLPVEYVENKKNFEDSVRTDGFSSVFIDNFGNGFGHFTPKGHSMVAHEISKVILAHSEPLN